MLRCNRLEINESQNARYYVEIASHNISSVMLEHFNGSSQQSALLRDESLIDEGSCRKLGRLAVDGAGQVVAWRLPPSIPHTHEERASTLLPWQGHRVVAEIHNIGAVPVGCSAHGTAGLSVSWTTYLQHRQIHAKPSDFREQNTLQDWRECVHRYLVIQYPLN